MAREQAGNEMRDDVPLAPCPFCGATNAHLVGGGVDGQIGADADAFVWVQCVCLGCGPIRSGAASAVAAWNHRAKQPGGAA